MSATTRIDRRRPVRHAHVLRGLERKYASEHDLVAAAKARQPDAGEALVHAFLPLIGSVARRYRGYDAVDRSELMQAGVLGLLRALERYDPDLGTPFWAYASWWVREGMQQVVSELEWPVVLSDRALRQHARIREAHRTHLQRDGREPSRAELAARTGIDRDRVERLMASKRRSRGLSEPVSGEADSGSTFADLLADPAAEDSFDRVLGRAETDHVLRALDDLNTRERSVVTQRFGLDGPPQTLRELACVLGVTAERVRQIEQTGLDKLRAAVTGDRAPSERANPAVPAYAVR